MKYFLVGSLVSLWVYSSPLVAGCASESLEGLDPRELYERGFEVAKVDRVAAEQHLRCAVEEGSFWAEILVDAIHIESEGIGGFKLDPDVFPGKGSSRDEYRLILEVAMYAARFFSQNHPPRPRLEDWLNSGPINYLEASKWVAYSWGREAIEVPGSGHCLFHERLLQLEGEFDRDAFHELLSRFRLVCAEAEMVPDKFSSGFHGAPGVGHEN